MTQVGRSGLSPIREGQKGEGESCDDGTLEFSKGQKEECGQHLHSMPSEQSSCGGGIMAGDNSPDVL